MQVDYDIGAKLSDLMTNAGLTSVTLNQLQPDKSNLNVKMQLYFAIAEAKPKLISVGFEEQALDSLLTGLLEFTDQKSSSDVHVESFSRHGI